MKCVHIYHLRENILAAFGIPLTKAVFVGGGLILVKQTVEVLTVQIKTENVSGGKVDE
jgi:hypothetical protein